MVQLCPSEVRKNGARKKAVGCHHGGRYNYCLAELFVLFTLEPNFDDEPEKASAGIVGHRGSVASAIGLRLST